MPDRPATDPTALLRELLGAEPPAGVLALSAEQRAALAQLVVDARRRQADSLAQAFADTLKHVPFPVRGIARKVLMG